MRPAKGRVFVCGAPSYNRNVAGKLATIVGILERGDEVRPPGVLLDFDEKVADRINGGHGVYFSDDSRGRDLDGVLRLLQPCDDDAVRVLREVYKR